MTPAEKLDLGYKRRNLLVRRKAPCFVLRVADRSADANLEDAAAGFD